MNMQTTIYQHLFGDIGRHCLTLADNYAVISVCTQLSTLQLSVYICAAAHLSSPFLRNSVCVCLFAYFPDLV